MAGSGQFLGSVFEDHLRERQLLGMRNGYGYMFHTQAIGDRPRDSPQREGRFPAGLASDFDIYPAHTAPPARAERFHGRFFCGETSRVTLVFIAVLLAISDFRGSKQSPEDGVAAPLNRRLNPIYFSNVCSQSDNHNASGN